jgi:twitching motility protein PilI
MFQRTTLREFQQNLSRRLVAAATSREESASVLAISTGGETWLIGLADAGEVLPVPALTAAPLSKPWYAGLANVRGSLYSVIDFGAFRGAEAARIGPASRLVLCGQRHGLNAGLLVDRVLGLRDARELKALETSTVGPLWQKSIKQDVEGRTCWELDAEALMRSADFMNVAL